MTTVFTYVDTYVVSDCATATQVYSVWYVADVRGTPYPAPYDVVTIGTASLPVASYSFPGLTITTLTPGEVITMVLSVGDEVNGSLGVIILLLI